MKFRLKRARVDSKGNVHIPANSRIVGFEKVSSSGIFSIENYHIEILYLIEVWEK